MLNHRSHLVLDESAHPICFGLGERAFVRLGGDEIKKARREFVVMKENPEMKLQPANNNGDDSDGELRNADKVS